MTANAKLAALRERSYSLASLPDSVRIPALAGRRDEWIKPVETASLDDIAFALLGLQEKASALYREIDALRGLYDLARRNGAVGGDIAVDTVPEAEERV